MARGAGDFADFWGSDFRAVGRLILRAQDARKVKICGEILTNYATSNP